VNPLIVDALATGQGKRMATRDVIGAGPRAVAGVLEQRGLEPRIAVAEAVLNGQIELKDYDILLVSGMSSDYPAVRRVISKWKVTSKGPILIGGPLSSSPEDALVRAKGDLAIIGEAEHTLGELLNMGLDCGRLPSKKALSQMLGIAYLDGAAVKMRGLRPVMAREAYDSTTPSTKIIKDYPLFYAARVYVEVLRGCSNYLRSRIALPGSTCVGCDLCRSGGLEDRYDCPIGIPPGCGYCSVPSLYGPPKSRSVEKICDEIRGLLSEGVRRIVLSAPGFLDYGRDLLVEPKPLTDPRRPEPNYEALERLLSRIMEMDEFTDGEASVMIENIKGALVTDHAADLLGRYLQGTPVNIGFETGSEQHSLQLGRPSTPEENLHAVRRLRMAGLKPYVYFIHGLPGQNNETVVETVKAMGESVESGASRIILYRFQPLPMSAFCDLPMAPPAAKDHLSGQIFTAAQEANRALKEELVGRRVRVIIAEQYERDNNFLVAYPLKHGPVVLVEGAEGLVGDVVEVAVSGVVSDRMVMGRLRR